MEVGDLVRFKIIYHTMDDITYLRRFAENFEVEGVGEGVKEFRYKQIKDSNLKNILVFIVAIGYEQCKKYINKKDRESNNAFIDKWLTNETIIYKLFDDFSYDFIELNDKNFVIEYSNSL